jgi:hypothetical protein
MLEATSATPSIVDDTDGFHRGFDQPAPSTLPSTASAPPAVSADAPAVAAALVSADKFLHPLRASEVVIGLATIFLWICLFLAGCIIETAPTRNLVSSGGASTLWELVGAWFILLTSYTVTNVAFLACLSAVIGKFAKRSLSFEAASLNGLPRTTIASFGEVMVLYSMSIARGFVIYLTLTGGLILLSTSTVTDSSMDEYVKLASTVSILAFMAGYDAEIFKRAIDRVASFSSDGKVKP